MKFVCEICHDVRALAAFSTGEGGTLSLQCGVCLQFSSWTPPLAAEPVLPTPEAKGSHAEAEALATATLKNMDVYAAPQGHCPKCIATRAFEAMTCHACGLVFSRFDPSTVAPSPSLGAAWRELLADWHAWPLHERALTLGTQLGELATLGRLYRIRVVAVPTDPTARKGRDEVVRRASNFDALVTPRPPPGVPMAEGPRPAWQWIGFAAVVLLSLGSVFWFLQTVWAARS